MIEMSDKNDTAEMFNDQCDYLDVPDSLLEALPAHVTTPPRKAIMETRILSLLELPESASEGEVYQAIKELKDRLELAESKVLEMEAERFVAENKEHVSDAEGLKSLYIKHGKEVASEFLKVFAQA